MSSKSKSEEETLKLYEGYQSWEDEVLLTLAEENTYRSNPQELTDEKLIKVPIGASSEFKVPRFKPVIINNARLLVEPKLYKEYEKGTTIPKAMVHPKKFNKRFLHFTGNSLIFMNWDNVMAAGGSISNICNPNIKDIKKNITDMDLFIYGLSPTKAQEKVLQIVKEVEEYYSGSSSVYVCWNKYTVNIVPRSKRQFKIQIILRCYKSMYEVLAGFDVDSCAVGYDGHNIIWTKRSWNCFMSGVNVVDLSRRSPSYEHRLYKYCGRGFGIWIPFDHSEINNLYFMNNAVQGFERLLYLTQFHNHRDMERFLYKMTRKRMLKLRKRLTPVSDYEGSVVDEMPTSNFRQDFSSMISKYNQKVPEEYRYMVSQGSSDFKDKVHKLKFLTENPGQQFTGSFHPITEGDWVKPIYDNRDHLGRNKVLLKVKSGECCRMSNETFNKFLVEQVYDKRNMDSSLYTFVDYYLMYGQNYEHLLQIWNNRDRIPSAKINLYWFNDPLILAILCNRTGIVKYVYQNPSDDYVDEDLLENSLIPAAIYCDNVEIMKILVTQGMDKEDPLEIEDYVNSKLKDLINHCHANRIAKFYGINMSTAKKKPNFSYTNYCKEEKIEDENDLLASLWSVNNCSNTIKDLLKDPVFYENITPSTLYIIYKLWVEKQGGTHAKHFIKAVLEHLVCKFTCVNAYEENDTWWQEIVISRLEEEYKNNSITASYTCVEFLKTLIAQTEHNKQMKLEDLEIPEDLVNCIKSLAHNTVTVTLAHNTVTVTVNPYEKVTAYEIFILKLLFNGSENNYKTLRQMLDTKKVKINIWTDNNDLYRRALFKLDSTKLLDLLVKKESQDKFLDKYRTNLGKTLNKLYETLKEQRINIRSDEIYKTYAKPMQFNKWHIDCLDTGSLGPPDKLQNGNNIDENVLGQTPYDYLIYQIMEGFSSFVYKWFNKKDDITEMTPSEVAKLENLRESILNVIDAARNSVLTTQAVASTKEMKTILGKI